MESNKKEVQMVFTIIGIIIAVLTITLIKNVIEDRINRKATGADFSEYLDITGLPVIRMTCAGKEMNFLVDSGSNVSHIDSAIFKKLKRSDYDIVCENIVETHTSGGKVIDRSKIIKAELQYNRQVMYEDFYVMDLSIMKESFKKDNVEVSGVLGVTFLKNYEYLIDFQNNMIYTKK